MSLFNRVNYICNCTLYANHTLLNNTRIIKNTFFFLFIENDVKVLCKYYKQVWPETYNKYYK